MQDYLPSPDRYRAMTYRRCGGTGLRLPLVSLGFWHNFGSVDRFETCRAIARTAFDLGITHFDLANNYGPEPGSAERTLGELLKRDFAFHRDELVISSKAGYCMWPGPYGDGGSRKYLISSCEQSLKRTGLAYFDVFYHHRHDPETPIEESMLALDQLVRSGKALYAGISNYSPADAETAFSILHELKTPVVLHQVRYNLFDRKHETQGSFDVMSRHGVGGIVFSPLDQGRLTNRYLNGIPADSRAARNAFLKEASITPDVLAKIRALDAVASSRGQTLAQLAIAWLLGRPGVTSALVGASSPGQIRDVVAGLSNLAFTADELAELDRIAGA